MDISKDIFDKPSSIVAAQRPGLEKLAHKLGSDTSTKFTLEEMTSQVIEQMSRYKEKMGTKPWDYKIAVKDLPCQIGSLAKLLMQLEGERYRHGKSDQEIKDGISDELADILSLVLFIAHELKIDIKQSWQGMLMSDEEKFFSRQDFKKVHHKGFAVAK